jgi:guanylate kinase
MSTLAKLIIISGPSGSGKSTVVQQLLAESDLPLTLSVSATTRPPRPGEQDGREYHFMTSAEFARKS